MLAKNSFEFEIDEDIDELEIGLTITNRKKPFRLIIPNPSTGDYGILPIVGVIAVAILLLVIIKRKKIKMNKNK